MNLIEYLKSILPLLLEKTVTRVDREIVEEDYIYKVTAYWAGTVIRIDVKPQTKEEAIWKNCVSGF